MIEADFCNADGVARDLYTTARDAIAAATAATGRLITFYQCNWGAEAAWLWGPVTANVIRNTGDICAPGSIAWEDILSNFDNTVQNSNTPGLEPGLPGSGPGAWNDPDMLGVGMPGITDVEGRSQFSLWCILGAPLILGADLRTMTSQTFDTISNTEAISVNQDASTQGVRTFSPARNTTPVPPVRVPTPLYHCLLVHCNVARCMSLHATFTLVYNHAQPTTPQLPRHMMLTKRAAYTLVDNRT
jgi:hypothetical protein